MPGQTELYSYDHNEIRVSGEFQCLPCTVGKGQNLTAGTIVGTSAVTDYTVAYDADSVSSATTPVAGADNTGGGTCSAVVTDDTATLTEDWVLTCTEESAGAGTFSVVGSESGDVGDATVGVEFSDADAKVTFTISDGTPDFAEGDTFTFSTSEQLATIANGILAEDVDATDEAQISNKYVKGTFYTADLTGLDANACQNMLAKTVDDYTII